MRDLLFDAAYVLGVALAVAVMVVGVVLLPSGYIAWGIVLLVVGLAGIAVGAWLDSWVHRPRPVRHDPVDAARVLKEPTVPLHVVEAISRGKCWPGCGCTRAPGRPAPRGQASGPAKIPPPTFGPAAPTQPTPPPGRLPFGMAYDGVHMPPEPWFNDINTPRWPSNDEVRGA